ncbi:MAG: FCD domain-containing protein [Rhodobacterales bacterium]|nr:FCD domain-containing protein [Rhodobacterales bacterium]
MQDLTLSPESSPTRTAEILDVLRDDIIEARRTPGERLRFDALREHYDIGISPLREALAQLAGEGLVVAEQRKGYRVAPVSTDDLCEIARLRSEFDALAIAESIRLGDTEWEGRVLAAFHALSRKRKIGPDGEIDKDWERFHIRFHVELVSACQMPKLLTFRAILEQQARRYRRISVHYMTAPRDDLAEHRAIHDAVMERDAAKAGKLIKEHYLRTVEIILTSGAAAF